MEIISQVIISHSDIRRRKTKCNISYRKAKDILIEEQSRCTWDQCSRVTENRFDNTYHVSIYKLNLVERMKKLLLGRRQ